MGEMELTQPTGTGDLLTLIGMAIEQLRHSIELFSSASQEKGATCLSSVVREIDAYMDRAQDDPLLKLAHIDAAHLASDLKHIKSDLVAVIERVNHPTPEQ